VKSVHVLVLTIEWTCSC